MANKNTVHAGLPAKELSIVDMDKMPCDFFFKFFLKHKNYLLLYISSHFPSVKFTAVMIFFMMYMRK